MKNRVSVLLDPGPGSLPGFRRRAGGVALVLVLSFLVIITALVIAFFTTVTTELSSAKGYEGEAVARQLGDSAVQNVMASITQATDTHNTTLHPNGPVAWASQPGMIWNYDSTNTPVSAYKLYSSDNMVVNGSFTAANDVPTDWSSHRSVFTDLNSPVTTASGAVDFPIIDGNAMKSMTVDGTTALTYSSDGTTQDVSGFSVDPAKVTYSSGSALSPANNPVPMPTRWLYVLKNGALTAADPLSIDTATFTSAPTAKQPSAANPVVGRVAFWTDDETCKVNLNTAGEGTFWDTPRGQSYTEQTYVTSQPVHNEFQRYPGHPSTVSLSAVFPTLAGNLPTIYSLVPRITAGGSNGGTTPTTSNPTPITTDSDRLYASLDELIFDPTRAVNPIPLPTSGGTLRQIIEQKKFFLTARSVAPELNLFDLPRVACWPIYKTTNSSYGSNNPPAYDTTRTTAYDRLIGTCSTINNNPYFFQRQSSMSPTNDLSTAIPRNGYLFSYLQALTGKAFPGFTGDFLSKYPVPASAANRASDRDQILTEIFDYIRSTNLYDDTLAASQGASAPFTPAVAKPGHGFVAPIHYTPSGSTGTTQGFGRAYTLSELGIGFICNAVARTAPAPATDDSYGSNEPTTNKVLGGTALDKNRKYIQAIIAMEFFSPMQGFTSIQPDMQVEITGLDGISVVVTDPDTGLQKNHPLNFPGDGYATYNQDPANNTYSGFGYGANPSWRYTLSRKVSPARGNLPSDNTTSSLTLYPFISDPVIIEAINSGGKMGFVSLNTIQVKIYAGSALSTPPVATPPPQANLIQTINLSLPSIPLDPTSPSSGLPIPNLVTQGTTQGSTHNTVMQNWWTFNVGNGPLGAGVTGFTPVTGNVSGRFYTIGESSWGGSSPVIASGAVFYGNSLEYAIDPTTYYKYDVVRTVYPSHGDYRLVAGQNNVPSAIFVPHARYNDSTRYMASSLSTEYDPTHEQGNDMHGKFIQEFNYGIFPDIPSNATQTPQTMKTFDVDSGTPNCADGAYINKPDEGDRDDGGNLGYWSNPTQTHIPGPTYFTPNRIMTSSGMFGSLPTGVIANKPWQTLLFRPQPTHPQSSSVPPFDADNGVVPSLPNSAPDHLFMDLFWMPVVEPYAISDRFSTAGKINMNYQIAPFSYITRNTALRALFKNEQMAAVANGSGGFFQNSTGYPAFKTSGKGNIGASSTGLNVRHSIDAYQTLTQFDDVFRKGQLFRSASQICDLYIIPQPNSSSGVGETSQTPQSMKDYWMTTTFPSTVGHAGTGDNLRERIYTTLYPRLTTKSNTFTVHFRAQALKQSPTSASAGTWSETKDSITGDFRGSSIIERYIDPSDSSIPDYAMATDPTTATALNSLYRWRVVENHRFAP